METVEYKNISFTVWDVGGQDKVLTPVYVPYSASHMRFQNISMYIAIVSVRF